MTDRAKRILELCDAWLSAATGAGGLRLGDNSEKFRLHANQIFPHELTLEELRVAHVALSRLLLLPGYGTIVDRDHMLLWAWEAELVIGTHRGCQRTENDSELRQAVEVAVHLLFAGRSLRQDGSSEAADRSRTALKILGIQDYELLTKGHDLLIYVAFPLLEGLLKRRAQAFTTADGGVSSAFDVPNRQGGRRSYAPGQQISSLRDLMWLERERLAPPDLAADIDSLMALLVPLEPDLNHGFDVIYRWRNKSLHGSRSFDTVGGTLIGLILRILLSEITEDFEQYRGRAWSSAHFRATRAPESLRNPWSYYPPA